MCCSSLRSCTPHHSGRFRGEFVRLSLALLAVIAAGGDQRRVRMPARHVPELVQQQLRLAHQPRAAVELQHNDREGFVPIRSLPDPLLGQPTGDVLGAAEGTAHALRKCRVLLAIEGERECRARQFRRDLNRHPSEGVSGHALEALLRFQRGGDDD
jgi:hypothetical protein